MECGVGSGSFHAVEALPGGVRLGGRGGLRWCSGKISLRSTAGTVRFNESRFHCSQRRKSCTVKATSTESNKCEFINVGSPLKPRSDAGKFLTDVLQNQPHNFLDAATEVIEGLALEKDRAIAQRRRSLHSREACLHRRIAEMKEAECQLSIEEVMYMLIVEKFSKLKVPMVPRLWEGTTNRTLDTWPSKDMELESVHCPEILEDVEDHISRVLTMEGKFGRSERWSRTQVSKRKLCQSYAMSIIYGYFLTEVSFRHQLELSIARVDEEYPLGCTICIPHLERHQRNFLENPTLVGRPFDPVSSLSPSLRDSRKPKDLGRYLTGLDAYSVKLCTRLRSQAALNLIDDHSLAVFANGKLYILRIDAVVGITYLVMRRLMLEAVAFGTFLWNAEQYIDSIYRLGREE